MSDRCIQPKPSRSMTPETDAMGRLNLSGNSTPAIWYLKILMPPARPKPGASKRKAGPPKPDHVAVTILGEICWWYRPQEVRDEQGNRIGWERKFHADILQLSPKQLSKKFGYSAKQCQRALARLEVLGLIKRELRDVPTAGGTLGNICFIRLFPAAVGAITWPGSSNVSTDLALPPLDTDVQTSGPGCPNITENTYKERKKTPKSPKRGLSSLAGEKDGHHPVRPSRGHDYVREANTDPVAQEFLSLLNRADFVQEGQRLARRFVNGRNDGRFTEADIRLVARMRDALPLPRTLDAVLDRFADLVAAARDIGEAERENLALELSPGPEEISAKNSVLRAATEFVAANPNPAFSFEGHLARSHPRWALLMGHQSFGSSNLDAYVERCRHDVLAELANDTAARAYLTDNDLSAEDLFGIDAGEVQAAADRVQVQRQTRMSELDQYLRGNFAV